MDEEKACISSGYYCAYSYLFICIVYSEPARVGRQENIIVDSVYCELKVRSISLTFSHFMTQSTHEKSMKSGSEQPVSIFAQTADISLINVIVQLKLF